MILIIDDQPERSRLQACMKSSFSQVAVASTIAEAWARIQANGNDICAVVLDIDFPEEEGLDPAVVACWVELGNPPRQQSLALLQWWRRQNEFSETLLVVYSHLPNKLDAFPDLKREVTVFDRLFVSANEVAEHLRKKLSGDGIDEHE